VFAESVFGQKGSSSLHGRVLPAAALPLALVVLACLLLSATPPARAAEWATSTSFSAPTSVAVSGSGGVFVADSGNDRIVKMNRAGVRRQILGKRGGGQVEFRNPRGVTVEPGGAIFIADTGNYRIQRLYPSGAYQTEWGSQGTGVGYFRNPNGVTIDGSGDL